MEKYICSAVWLHLAQSVSRGQQREPLQPQVNAARTDVPQIEPLQERVRRLIKHTFLSKG